MSEIVKVQLPIYPPDGLPLIYDKNSIHVKQQLLPSSIKFRIRRMPLPKAFYYAKWTGQEWKLLKPAPYQEW